MSGDTTIGVSPATPLRLTSLCQIASSEDGVYTVLPHTPFGLSCGAILLCDLSRSAAHARATPTGASSLVGPMPLSFAERSLFIYALPVNLFWMG